MFKVYPIMYVSVNVDSYHIINIWYKPILCRNYNGMCFISLYSHIIFIRNISILLYT